ncbi:MAG: hypothetical protein ACJ8C4_13610 [Gemmataceae bacterium]
MRPIRLLLGGIALALASGCMSGKGFHVSVSIGDEQPACHSEPKTPEGEMKQTAHTALKLPDADGTALPAPRKVEGPDIHPGEIATDDACCSEGNCRPKIFGSRGCDCDSDCEKGGCLEHLKAFFCYKPLYKGTPPTSCPDCNCYPPAYTFFTPSHYNKSLEPLDCADEPWYKSLFSWKRTECKARTPVDCDTCQNDDRVERVYERPVIARRAVTCRSACAAYSQAEACDSDCGEPVRRPALARVRNAATVIGSAGCSGSSCSSGGCGGGIQGCQRPKPRLDGLPVLPPTMFRKYEPCDGPDATALLAPVPGTGVPVERLETLPTPIETKP